jgi:hypothetical protein
VNPLGKLPGSVWTVPSQPLTVPPELGVDHFAAFPMEWPRRLIMGWSPSGVCTRCGEGRRPVVDKRTMPRTRKDTKHLHERRPDTAVGSLNDGFDMTGAEWTRWRNDNPVTIGGEFCACTPYTDHPERRGKSFHDHSEDGEAGGRQDASGRWAAYVDSKINPRGPVREYELDSWSPPPTRPAVILDPFGGTGTVALVADVLGRIGVTVDMSADYSRLARWRCNDPAQRAAAMQVDKPDPVIDGQLGLFEGAL